jgi:hypothetical protein
MKFKTKLDFVHAMRFTEQTKDDVWKFVTCAKCMWTICHVDLVLLIQSGGAEQRAYLGDWVVKMTNGNFKVFTQSEFDAVYELVGDDQNEDACQVNVDEFTALGIEGADVLFRTCCKVCRNTGDCGPDCRDFPSGEVIELLKRRIVELQGVTNDFKTQCPAVQKGGDARDPMPKSS